MRIKLFLLPITLLCTTFFSSAGNSLIKDPPLTWQEQLDNKSNYTLGNGTDFDSLKLLGYTYKGEIQSEEDKAILIDSIFSLDSFIPIHYDPVVEVDTLFSSGIYYKIKTRTYPMFEILPIREILEMNGGIDPLVNAKEGLLKGVKVGFGIVELEYEYKGNRFSSIAIVSNEHGGVVHDNIAINIIITEDIEEYMSANPE